jgi:pectinesterase
MQEKKNGRCRTLLRGGRPKIEKNQKIEAASMLEICVRQDGTGHFTSVSEAVLAVPYDLPAVIDIGPGIYREKLVCEKKCVTLRGAGAAKTRLVWGDGGKRPYADPRDGRLTHTFRSYTAFFGGEFVRVEDLTIENDVGPGAQAGQGIAAYVDAAHAVFERVRLVGHQDTLFCAPLPDEEREKDGFLGPRMLAPRRASAQYYHACDITGDVDFIFGGADALFEGCTIRSRNTPPQSGNEPNGTYGYVAAPCGKADALGFVFECCDFVSDCPAGTVYLGRPWRPEGKAAVLHSRLGAHIRPAGFSPWGDRTDFARSGFAECGNTGPGAQPRPAPVRMLHEEQAAHLLQTARARCCEGWETEND